MAWKAPGERLVTTEQDNVVDYLTYLRHLFAYETARHHISGTHRVLDVGCGIGYGTSTLAEVAANVVGVDVAAEAIAAANARPHNSRATFRQYDGLRLPFDDSSFDVVTAFQVVEHVADDTGFLREIRRVLQPGGKLILSTPNKAFRVAPGRKHWWRYHVREYTPLELREVLRRTFSQFEVFALRATQKIEDLEIARVAMARKLAAVDPLDLRRFVPRRLVSTIHRRLARSQRVEETDFRGEFHVGDYRLTADDLNRGIDLFAICYREATSS